jgi:alkanesulfonate monooxygenase SsuD/methylene tetrahydromethanopterin reductase-like flavin-dependent oxidoreductase (luciferase family)
MEFVVAMAGSSHPARAAEWFAARQDEGWHGVSVGDHLSSGSTGGPYPHVWATLGHWAALGGCLLLTTTYANNLVRSPVEFVHASLTVQAMSGGRFEAGLGTGWREADLGGSPVPDPPSRARRYREAMVIARDLLKTGTCSFHGDFYDVEVTDQALPAVEPPPPLVAAVGGPWVIDNVSPLADRVEVNPIFRVGRQGYVVPADWAQGSPQDIGRQVERVRAANPDVAVQIGLFVAAGGGPAVDAVAQLVAGGPLDGLVGEPGRVADALLGFQDLGVDRLTLLELAPGTYRALAPLLVG